MVSNDLTDVTLVSDDTERGLDWCDFGGATILALGYFSGTVTDDT